jgi:hypothetical protein
MKNKNLVIVGLMLGSFALEGCSEEGQDVAPNTQPIEITQPSEPKKSSGSRQRKHVKKKITKKLPMIPPAPPVAKAQPVSKALLPSDLEAQRLQLKPVQGNQNRPMDVPNAPMTTNGAPMAAPTTRALVLSSAPMTVRDRIWRFLFGNATPRIIVPSTPSSEAQAALPLHGLSEDNQRELAAAFTVHYFQHASEKTQRKMLKRFVRYVREAPSAQGRLLLTSSESPEVQFEELQDNLAHLNRKEFDEVVSGFMDSIYRQLNSQQRETINEAFAEFVQNLQNSPLALEGASDSSESTPIDSILNEKEVADEDLVIENLDTQTPAASDIAAPASRQSNWSLALQTFATWLARGHI